MAIEPRATRSRMYPGSRPSCSATVRICGVILPARAKSICVMGSFGGLPAVLMVLMHSLPSLALSISGSSGRGGRCPSQLAVSSCRLPVICSCRFRL